MQLLLNLHLLAVILMLSSRVSMGYVWKIKVLKSLQSSLAQVETGVSFFEESHFLSELFMKPRFATNEEEYSACLTPKQQLDQFKKEDYSVTDESPKWIKAITRPLRRLKRSIFPSISPKPGNLILIKTGETTWRQNYTFTGWADPDLTLLGQQEIEHAAR